jgi:hypothetical protein
MSKSVPPNVGAMGGDGPWLVTVGQGLIERSEPDNLVFEGNATFVVVERMES